MQVVEMVWALVPGLGQEMGLELVMELGDAVVAGASVVE